MTEFDVTEFSPNSDDALSAELEALKLENFEFVPDDEQATSSGGEGEGMEDYHSQLTSAYYRIAAAEAEQEELLDDISQHQRTIAELQAELRLSVKNVTQTRVELEKVNAQLESAQRDQEREELEKRELQKQLDAVQAHRKEEDGPITQVLKDLITTKTNLAEVTEERDRRRLEKKHLEDELARVKCELAAMMAEVDDTEAELRTVREENRDRGIPNVPL